MMTSRLRLRWSKFGLSHHRPASFGTAQWQKRETVSTPYLLYRMLVFAFFWGFLIAIIVTATPDVRPYFMIYLTMWTYMTALLDVALQLVASFTVAFRHHYEIKPVCPPVLYKTHWVIVNISHTMEPFITILFWSTVFPQLDHDVAVSYTNIHLHLITTMYAIMDLLIHGSPRRYHHVLYPLCFALAYLLFTVIYYLCGGVGPNGETAIYPILDWAQPGMTIGVAFGAVLAIFIIHGFTWGLVKLRQNLHRRWHGPEKAGEVVVVEEPTREGDGGENGGVVNGGCVDDVEDDDGGGEGEVSTMQNAIGKKKSDVQKEEYDVNKEGYEAENQGYDNGNGENDVEKGERDVEKSGYDVEKEGYDVAKQ